MPTISVIVPVYKVEPYLRRCVDSILDQTYSDFELILVDDGSPDNCGAICDEYAQKDSRVVVIHQENGGLSAARNAGIDWAFANSDSRWLSFIDSDDWIHPQYLERLLDAAEKKDLPVSVTSFQRVSSETDVTIQDLMTANPEIWETEELFCKKNVEATIACAKLYRKELFRDLRYPVGRIHEDEFLTYQILFQTKQVVFLPEPMYWYFQNENGIMHAKWTAKRLDNIDAHREQIRFFRKNGYTSALQVKSRHFALLICRSLAELKKTEIRDKYLYEKKLKKELRRHLRSTRRFFDLSTEADRGFFYVAFPVEMKLRRFVQRKTRAMIFIWKSAGLKGIMKKFVRR